MPFPPLCRGQAFMKKPLLSINKHGLYILFLKH